VLPVVLTGPAQSAGYFDVLRRFLVGSIGEQALSRISFVIDEPAEVARLMVRSMRKVRASRRANKDSFNFNWLLAIPPEFQHPFVVTHESMRALQLHRDQPAHLLVANLRRAFSGIVTGNVKDFGIAAIEREGPYELSGDPSIMKLLDELLTYFVTQQRMKLPGSIYRPCYRLIAPNA
jgi:hypothetical protein